MKFLFQPLQLERKVSDMAADVIRIASLSERLAEENRKRVAHPSGRPENVAEHSLMLVKVAVALAQKYFPELDPGKVAIHASHHDDVEAYVGDTPTGEWCETDYETKEAQEKAGFNQLVHDFEGELPQYVDGVRRYEAQEEPGARFVRMVDKVICTVIQITDGGQEANKNFTVDNFLSNEQHGYDRHIANYPEWKEVLDIKIELARYINDILLKRES